MHLAEFAIVELIDGKKLKAVIGAMTVGEQKLFKVYVSLYQNHSEEKNA